ncbi:MAG TPA: HAD family hydrolase [Gaiellaceae bacterium]|nr:HAD family hydrolase [Gaiellaceae bacterium]
MAEETHTDELDSLRAEWRAALSTAREALEANEDELGPTELASEKRHLREEYAHAADSLRSYALDEGLPPELAQPFLPRGLTRRALGLPPTIEACVFELDGVLVASTNLHMEAWRRAFDELLGPRIEATYRRLTAPFDPHLDYPAYVEGRTRLDGVRSFLASRGIRLPEGSPGDPPGSETVHGVANRKREQFDLLLSHHGVRAFEGCRHYLSLAHDAGIAAAVVSASAHTHEMLERGGLASLVDAIVDGETFDADRLREACRSLDVEPEHAAAFVAGRAGVEAARAAGFGYVVAIAPDTQAAVVRELHGLGAGAVVPALASFLERS